MSLKTILAAKGGNIVCIEPTADLAAAAKLLSTHRIGALVVLDGDGRLVGILSERDIVRTHRSDVGSTVLQLPVAQVMTRNVSHLRREQFDQQRYGPHDERQIPPCAGARQGSPHRHGVDRRCAKMANGDDTRTYPSIRTDY